MLIMKRKSKPPKPTLNEAAREYFRMMGAIGGYKRASNMKADERKASALKAITARWNKAKRERFN